MNIAIEKKNVVALIFILILSLILRVWGINFFHQYHPDETKKVEQALSFIKTNGVDLNPRYFEAPNFLLYSFFSIYYSYYQSGKIFGFFRTESDFKEHYKENPIIFFIIARIFVVIMAIATIFLIFLVGKELFNSETGLISALLLAISPLHSVFSHYAKEDIPLTFWVMLTLFFSIFIIKKGRMRDYILTGLAAGIAMSTKWIGINCIIFIIIGYFIRVYKNKHRDTHLSVFNNNFIVALFFMVLGFLIFSPFVLIEKGIFLRDLDKIINHTIGGRYGVPPYNPILQFPLLFIKETLWINFYSGMGALISIFCILGLVYSILKHTENDILLLVFVIIFCLQIWTNYNANDKYFLPVVPLFCIIGARFISRIHTLISQNNKNIANRAFFLSFLLILIAQPLINTVCYDCHMISDTRTLASKWIIEHIPKGSIIAAEGIREGAYMPPVSETEYKLIKVDLLADHPLDYYLENKADYLIASSLCYYRYTEEATPERFLFYRNLFKDYKTIKEFRSPFGQYAFHNPIIKIIRLSQDKNDSL